MMDSYSRTFRIAALAGVLLAKFDAAQAAGITGFFVRQGVNYEQNSASPPATPSENGTFIARVTGPSSEGTLLSTPSDVFQSVPVADPVEGGYQLIFPGPPNENADLMPPGDYIFTFPDSTKAPLNFSAGAFPTTVPQIVNYAATQAVAPASALNLTFNTFTGAGANDLWEFQVIDANGNSVLTQSGPIGTTVSVPANTLTDGETYDAYLRFVHNVASNSSSVPGVTGTAGYYNETHFQLVTTGAGGGGGGDNPTLAFTNPANGATGVAVNTPIMFTFSKPMAQQQSILWTGVDASKFSYAWSFGQLLTATYAGGLPANTAITYSLQAGATGFKDTEGNPLTTPAQGSFTTGSGGGSTGGGTGVDPCLTGTNNATGNSSGSVFKALRFVQTSNSAPVPDTESPAAAFATYIPTNQTVNSVTVTLPNNSNITLDKIPLANIYSAFQEFPTGAAVDAAFPAGNYTITASPAGSGVITVQAVSAMPVPTVLNLTQLQSFDPTKDFVLNFSPFTGASGQFDNIQIQINDSGSDRHFYAPDFCVPRTLPNTATSVTIPANTFHAGDKLKGSITFNRFTVNANAIPNTTLSAGATVTTSFDFTGGSSGSEVHWNQPVFNANGTITFTATAPTGTTVIIEKSTDLKTWTTATTSTSANGTITYTFDPKTGGPHTYFRGKVQ